MPKAKPKPQMGRPPIAEEDRRNKLIKVLVTEAEDAELREAAKASGLTVSTWVRSVALDRAREG